MRENHNTLSQLAKRTVAVAATMSATDKRRVETLSGDASGIWELDTGWGAQLLKLSEGTIYWSITSWGRLTSAAVPWSMALKFSFAIDKGDWDFTVDFEGRLDGDQIEGSYYPGVVPVTGAACPMPNQTHGYRGEARERQNWRCDANHAQSHELQIGHKGAFMKITDVKVTVWEWKDIPPTLHPKREELGSSAYGTGRIITDEGIEGHAFLGNALSSLGNDANTIIERFKPMLVGQDLCSGKRSFGA